MKRVILALALLAATALSASVWAGPIVRLQIRPGHVNLRPGATEQFEVYGLDAFDNEVEITEPVTWSTEIAAGTITQSGTFTAGTSVRRTTKGVKATAGGLSTFAMVTVSSVSMVGGYTWEKSWGDLYPGRLCFPRHVEMGPNNTVFVVDSSGRNVQEFDRNGNCINMYGPMYSATSFYPTGVGFYNGKVYVSTDYNIVIFDASGNLVGTWGGSPQIGQIGDMGMDKYGNVYISEVGGGRRVQKFTSTGTWLKSWGSAGTGEGQFDGPWGMFVDPEGYVYVADTNNSRIQKFDSNGKFLTQWSDLGPEYGKLSYPGDLTVDSAGNMYIADQSNSRVVKVTPSGNVEGVWQTGMPFYPSGATVDADGNVYAVSYQDGYVKKFDANGVFTAEFGRGRDGALFHPGGIGVSLDGTVYVASNYRDMQIYSSTGRLTGVWPTNASNVRVDSQGYVYLSRYEGVSKHTPDGQQVMRFDPPRLDGEWPRVYGVAIAPSGDVYVSDDNKNQISRFGADGALISQWGSTGSGNGTFSWLHSLAVDASGNVYAVDSDNHRIQKFDAAGRYISQWGAGSMLQPWGICVSPSGFVFTAEEGYDRVQKFDTSGNPIALWGGAGTANGKFYGCNDVAVDAQDNVYVVDMLNNRVCKFARVQGRTGSVKSLKDGEYVILADQVVSAATTEMGGHFYMEAKDRSAGIKVTGKTAARGARLVVEGTMTTIDGERAIKATNITLDGTDTVEPLALTNKSLGGGDLNYDPIAGTGQRGVVDGSGANNIGLLVKTTGVVTASGADFYYVDDGTHARDGSIFVGVRVLSRYHVKPPTGSFVSVTGISRMYKVGDRYVRAIAPRTSADAKVIN